MQTSMRAEQGVVLTRVAIAAIAAIFLLMGLVVSAYGPLLEHLTRRYGVSLPIAGATISVHFAGSLPGVFFAMWAMQRVRARDLVIGSGVIVALGLALISVA